MMIIATVIIRLISGWRGRKKLTCSVTHHNLATHTAFGPAPSEQVEWKSYDKLNLKEVSVVPYSIFHNSYQRTAPIDNGSNNENNEHKLQEHRHRPTIKSK
jgi:hypothetical protein